MNLAIKSISVILSVIMAILPTLQAAPQPTPGTTAAENYKYTLEDMSVVYDEKDENGNYYPLVVVPGISHSITYVVDENYDYANAEDPSKPPIKQDAFGNDMTGSTIILDIPATVLAAVTQFIVPLVLSVMTQSDAGLINGIAKLADAAFSVQKTLPDGTFANNEIGLLEFNGSFADFATKDHDNQSYMEYQTEYLYKILPDLLQILILLFHLLLYQILSILLLLHLLLHLLYNYTMNYMVLHFHSCLLQLQIPQIGKSYLEDLYFHLLLLNLKLVQLLSLQFLLQSKFLHHKLRNHLYVIL